MDITLVETVKFDGLYTFEIPTLGGGYGIFDKRSRSTRVYSGYGIFNKRSRSMRVY